MAKWVRRRQGSPRHAELGLWLAWVRPYGLISTNNGGNNVGLAWLHKVVKIVVEVRIGLIKSIKYMYFKDLDKRFKFSEGLYGLDINSDL